MNCIKVLGALLFALTCSFAGQALDSTEWKRALDFYEKGQFRQAAERWESLVEQEQWSPDLFFNLGNAYYRLDRWGMAILFYERALWLDPAHEGARKNLSLASAHKIDHQGKIDYQPMPWYEKWVFHPSINEFCWIIFGFITLFVFTLIVFHRLNPRVRPVLYPLWLMLFVLGLPLFAVTLGRIYLFESENHGIVLENGVEIYPQRDLKGKYLAEINEGTKVKLLEENEKSALVEVSESLRGFIRRSDVQAIKGQMQN